MYNIFQRCVGGGRQLPQCSTGPHNKNEKNKIKKGLKGRIMKAGDRMGQTRRRKTGGQNSDENSSGAVADPEGGGGGVHPP